jgi:hypothetical protein
MPDPTPETTTSMADFLIILDRATEQQRRAVHEVIKENARTWWHRFVDVWIVHGKSADRWRDLVGDEISNPATVLVIRFPTKGDETRWSARGPDTSTKFDWFHKNL